MGIPLPVVTTRYFPYSSSTHLSLAVQSEQEPHKGGATPLCLHHFAPTYALILKQELCSCEVPSVHTANHVVPPCLACRRWGPSRPQKECGKPEDSGRGKYFSPARSICSWLPLHLLWCVLHKGQSADPLANQLPHSTLQAQPQGCPMARFSTQGAGWGPSGWDAPCPLHCPLQMQGAHAQHSCRWRSSDTSDNLEARATGVREGTARVPGHKELQRASGTDITETQCCTPSRSLEGGNDLGTKGLDEITVL